MPLYRPQIFLTDGERESGIGRWATRQAQARTVRRVVIGPGGGFPEKCWSLESYKELVRLMARHLDLEFIIVGGKQDYEAGEELASVTKNATNLAGKLNLRETFAAVAAADIVLCNSSMLMHAAAAFGKSTFVFLGEHFASAPLHHAQWGYPEICWVLGKDENHPAIYTPQEAFRLISRYLAEDTNVSASLPQACGVGA